MKNFSKVLVIVISLALLMLSGCGGQEPNSKKPSSDSGSGKANATLNLDVTGFKNVGNNPNNLFMGATDYNMPSTMVFDDEHIYFARTEDAIYRIKHNGEGLTKLTDHFGCRLNLYGEYLYYYTYERDTIERYHIPSGTIEKLYEQTPQKDKKINAKQTYKGYNYIDNLFIVDGFLFFTDARGFENTDMNRIHKLCALDLNSMTMYDSLDDDDYGLAYTTDGKYYYSINTRTIKRLELSKIKSGAEMEILETINCDNGDRFIVGTNGFCTVEEIDGAEKLCLYEFDKIVNPDGWGNKTEVADFSKLNEAKITGYDKNFIVGNSFIDTPGNSFFYFENNNFEKVEKLSEYDNQTGHIKAIGTYNKRLYAFVDDNLVTITEDGKTEKHLLSFSD